MNCSGLPMVNCRTARPAGPPGARRVTTTPVVTGWGREDRWLPMPCGGVRLAVEVASATCCSSKNRWTRSSVPLSRVAS